MYKVSRDDVKNLAVEIERLAKDLQSKLDSGINYIIPANELVKSTQTMVFSLGELYAVENGAKHSSRTNRTYTRDRLGRFSSKP
jgi:hypothetical protein